MSKLQLSSSGVSWPYIALCPMELWVMLQSIMGVKKKKKKNYGMGTPPPLWTDRLMDGQTRVKTLPSRRTTYAGGNYLYQRPFSTIVILQLVRQWDLWPLLTIVIWNYV